MKVMLIADDSITVLTASSVFTVFVSYSSLFFALFLFLFFVCISSFAGGGSRVNRWNSSVFIFALLLHSIL